MAIFAPNHRPVGRSTHAAGTAGAHALYITRAGAASLVMSEHMPSQRGAAHEWLNERELADRKNARVCDKLMLPLPVELDASQRADLVRDFMAELGGGRASWLASFHDRGKDEHNPHVHVIFRDKDYETGKRVFGTSDKGSTDRIRALWETANNLALERAGLDVRVDRRSLAEQGIDRQPGIHIGPNVLAMEERGLRPASVAQELDNGRVINWPEIDQGRTRAEYQREIEAANRERERDREKGGDRGAALKPAAVILEAEPEQQLADELELEHRIPAQDPTPDFARDLAGEIHEVTTPAPAMSPEDSRRQWAEQLKDLATDNAPEIIEPDRPPAPEQRQEQQWPELGGTDLPAHQPEATQRPSQELAQAALKAERGRLAEWLTVAREKLASVADRLERAFGRIMEQERPKPAAETPRPRTPEVDLARPRRSVADDILDAARRRQQEREQQRQAEKKPEPEKDKTRSIWDDFAQGPRKPRWPGDTGP